MAFTLHAICGARPPRRFVHRESNGTVKEEALHHRPAIHRAIALTIIGVHDLEH